MGSRLYKCQKKPAQQNSLYLAFSKLVLMVKFSVFHQLKLRITLQTSEMLTIFLDTLTLLTQSIIFNNTTRLISRNVFKAIVLSSSDTLAVLTFCSQNYLFYYFVI